MFFGTGYEVGEELANARKIARAKRNGGKSSRALWRMRRGDEFRGVAIATAAVQKVVRRSSASSSDSPALECD
jgi:hypothetical protein